MSLIGEALRRAREHAARQGDTSMPPAPFPTVAPPPRPARPRNLIALSIGTSLAVSLLVAGGLYLLLARPATVPGPENGGAAPASGTTAAASASPAPSTSSPTATRAAPATQAARQAMAAQAPTTAAPAPHAAASTNGRAEASPNPAASGTAATNVDPYPEATPPTATLQRPAPTANPGAPTPPTTTTPRPAPGATRGGGPAPASAAKPSGIELPDGTHVTLDGIVWGEAPIAMLNGRLMSAGERLGSYTLARIEPQRVTLLGDDGRPYVIELAR